MAQTETLEIQLLSGVTFPDWSVVTSDKVRASLNDTLGRLRMTTRWGDMTIGEETVRRAILNLYVESGHAPSIAALVERSGLSISELLRLLSSLEQRDLIVVSQSDQTIETAYPFTDRNTEHAVRIGEVTLKAMCAIDALGVGAMLERDTAILSKCRHCECDIQIQTGDNGRTIASISPENAIVWSGVQDIDGCAADTQCSVMAYFCSDNHLDLWRDGKGGKQNGHRLSIKQGLEAGAAIFIPFLAAGKASTDQSNKEAN